MLIETLRPATVAAILLAVLPSSRSDAQETNDASGRALYARLGCETCHGAAGLGTAAGPSLSTGALSLPDFNASVRRPTGTMPPYSTEDLSARDLRDLYAYLNLQDSPRAPGGRVDVGARLYRRTGCYECHSNEAQGGAQGPRLGPDPVTLAMFIWYVRYPTGSMPPYTTKVLSDRDLADIYAFVEARPQPPAAASIPLLAPKH